MTPEQPIESIVHGANIKKQNRGGRRQACLFGGLLPNKTFLENKTQYRQKNVGNGAATMFDCFGILFGCLLVSKHTSVNKKSLEGNLHGNLYKGLVMRVCSSGKAKYKFKSRFIQRFGHVRMDIAWWLAGQQRHGYHTRRTSL